MRPTTVELFRLQHLEYSKNRKREKPEEVVLELQCSGLKDASKDQKKALML